MFGSGPKIAETRLQLKNPISPQLSPPIASKINAIGNTQAVSNTDIVEFLTRSSSAMKEANNTLDETIALGTAA